MRSYIYEKTFLCESFKSLVTYRLVMSGSAVLINSVVCVHILHADVHARCATF